MERGDRMKNIYLDHAATSPPHPQVIEKMMMVLRDSFGNASSLHSYGREARRLLDDARLAIASSIHAAFSEIVFTSGGTEADNLAIVGTALAKQTQGKHVITTSIEHPAVLQTYKFLEKNGFTVTYLPVDQTGVVSIEDVRKALQADTILVSIMYGNNEVGSLQPIEAIGELLRDHPAIFHTDAVQAYGIETLNVQKLNVDLLSTSAHKINGPKGIGFLYVKTGVQLAAGMYGGEQERKRRAGTENIPGIVGFAEAVKIVQAEMENNRVRYRQYQQLFLDTLHAHDISFEVNGDLKKNLPHILNLSFPGADVETLLVQLDLAGIAASSGSACTAGSFEPSHVLVAMFGKESKRIRNSIRFSFGLNNTTEQIEAAALEVVNIMKRHVPN